MAVKSFRNDDTFPLGGKNTGGVPNLQNVSEIWIINKIVMKFHPRRRVIAGNQIGHLIEKIKLYPEKEMFYITLIKKLIESENNGVKNEQVR